MKIKEISWTEERQPNEKIRYNHVVGNLGELEFTIEWKGWKEYDSYCLYEHYTDRWIESYYSLNEAKSGATEWLKNFVNTLIEGKRMKPKAGDIIRIVREHQWYGTEVLIFTLEEFRHTLGFFETDEARQASRFTALSDGDLYGDGPESDSAYISHYGPYRTNQIPLFEIISQ